MQVWKDGEEKAEWEEGFIQGHSIKVLGQIQSTLSSIL